MEAGVDGVSVATAVIMLEITSIEVEKDTCQQGVLNSMELLRSSVRVIKQSQTSVMGAFGIGLLQLLVLGLLTLLLVR